MEITNGKVEGTKQELVTVYRLGLYDPDPKRKRITYVGRPYRPNELEIMKRAVDRYNRVTSLDDEPHLCIGIFQVEG